MRRNVEALALRLSAVALALSGCGDAASDGERNDAGAGGWLDARFPFDADVCGPLAMQARQQLDAYLTTLKRTATLSCQVDAECALVSLPSLNCVVPCGQLLWSTDVAAFTAATANLCDAYFAAGCPKRTPPCPLGYAICEQGGCNIGAPRSPTDGGGDAERVDVPPALDLKLTTPDAPICDQLAATAQAQATSYIQANYSLACQVDSDCSFLQARALSCFAVCGNFVVRSADVSALQTATAGYCSDYFAAGCPERVPPCPYARPVCDRGACAHGPLPPGPADTAVEAGPADVALAGGAG